LVEKSKEFAFTVPIGWKIESICIYCNTWLKNRRNMHLLYLQKIVNLKKC